MIRVALIGCGAIGETGHLPALQRHPEFALTAVCDRRPERAGLLAETAGGVPVYTDWRELLEAESLDAAILALPPEVSPPVALGCLGRGLHVLDEKPLAATVAEGRRVAAAAAGAGVAFQVGFVLRYGDWVCEVGKLARVLGSPARVRVVIHDERLDRADADHLDRIKGFLRNSSAMTHEGSHVVDYASLWNPAPWTRVEARTERTADDFPGPNLWHATIRQADGSVLEIEIGWLLPELSPCSVTIEASGGCLELNLSTGAGHVRRGHDVERLALPPLAPEWERQYNAFARAIAGQESAGATVEDGLRALIVTAACEESARLGRAVAADR